MNLKFRCKKCGECCHFQTYLPLTEWEAKEIQEIADKKNIEINIKPLPKATNLDKKSGKTFCIKYGMFNAPCPFLLKDNSCSIYEARPLRCKQFPMLYTPLTKIERTYSPACFMKCKHFDNKKMFHEIFMPNGPTPIDKQELKNKLIDIYGIDIFACALQENMASEFILDQLSELAEDKKIKLRKVDVYNIKNKEVIPSLDFLEFLGLLDEESKESLITSLKDTDSIKKKLLDSLP